MTADEDGTAEDGSAMQAFVSRALSPITGLPEAGAPAARGRGNNLDSIRRHNLSLVLQEVHRSGGISRSALARHTGLNRSTIAVLVNELVELGLVDESMRGTSSGAGRPGSVVRPHGRTVAIAVNPEVDAITVGIIGLGGEVHNRVRYPTDRSPSVREAVNITAIVLETILSGFAPHPRVVGIGVAVPGLIRDQDGTIHLAPALGWHEEPLAAMLSAATGYPAAVANEAGLGTVAEARFGAGRDASDMIYLSGGAGGIGGGIISGGRPLRGADGYAGDFGQTFVAGPIVTDGSGAPGSLDQAVSRERLMEALHLSSADPDEFERALLSSDDPAVVEQVARQLDFLGIALGNAISILNPQLVILGGFLGSLYAADPDRLWTAVKSRAPFATRSEVHIRRAQLGSNLFMVGAAELAFRELLEDPAGYVFTGED
jgi:predicted NBD/HSP70 family sugar kinase